MKRLLSIFLPITLIVSAACSKVVENPSEDILDVTVPGRTKVHLNGLKTCWDKGDELTVFYRSSNSEKWVFKGNTGDVSGQIGHETVLRDETRNDIQVLYPYDPDATLDGNVLSTNIPYRQEYRSGTYGTAVLAGKTDYCTLELKYCTAIIELRYNGPADISHIVLDGNDSEKLSGKCNIAFEKGEPQVTCQGTSSVTLDCDVSVPDSSTISFYFSIAPCTFKKGLSFTVHTKEGKTHVIRVTEPVSVDAGHIYTVTEYSTVIPEDQKVMYLIFSDGTTRQNPFTEDITFTCGKEIGPYYYRTGNEMYPFYMFCKEAIPSGTTKQSNFRITNGGGLYIGGFSGDYIKLPAVSGYRLQKISVSLNKNSYFHISPLNKPEETIIGGNCSDTDGGDFRTLYLSATTTGTSYMMYIDNQACFRSINLYYCK